MVKKNKTVSLSHKTSSVVSRIYRQRVNHPPHIKWISKGQRVTHRLFECLGCGATGFRFDSSRGRRHLACVDLLPVQEPNSAGNSPPQEAVARHEAALLAQPNRSNKAVSQQVASVMASAAQTMEGAMNMYVMLGGAVPEDVKRAMALVVAWAAASDGSKPSRGVKGRGASMELAAGANVERYQRCI